MTSSSADFTSRVTMGVVPTTSICMQADLTSSQDAGTWRKRLRQGLERQGVRVESTSQDLVGAAGSRLDYRLWGVSRGIRQLPLEVRISIEPALHGSFVAHVTLDSDAGWYLFQTSFGRRAYGRRFDGIVEDLRATVS